MGAVAGVTLTGLGIAFGDVLALVVLFALVIVAIGYLLDNIPIINKYKNGIVTTLVSKVVGSNIDAWRVGTAPLIDFIRSPSDYYNELGSSISNYMYKANTFFQSVGHIVGNRLGIFTLIIGVGTMQKQLAALQSTVATLAGTPTVTQGFVTTQITTAIDAEKQTFTDQLDQMIANAKTTTDDQLKAVQQGIDSLQVNLGTLVTELDGIKAQVGQVTTQIGVVSESWVNQTLQRATDAVRSGIESELAKVDANVLTNAALVASIIAAGTTALASLSSFMEDCATPMCETMKPQLQPIQDFTNLIEDGTLLLLISQLLFGQAQETQAMENILNPVIQTVENMMKMLQQGGG